MNAAKPFEIDKRLIYEAYKKVKSNRGSAGIDGVSMEEFDNDLSNNLYRLWNRMSSGSYMPKSVKLVEIPKPNGGKRPLGIPTISDRIAQMAVVLSIMPSLDAIFHEDSYGYRPNKSAHDAIAKGVVVMGLEKITFGWYMKKITWIAFVGYLAGILCYWFEKAFLF